MAISPRSLPCTQGSVSSLVNAEASLAAAVAATTAQVQQIATSALPTALAELHNAVEEAKSRIQSAAMLYRATLNDLGFDIASLTAGILEDLETASQPQPLPAPATDKEGEGATPVSPPLPVVEVEVGDVATLSPLDANTDQGERFLAANVAEEEGEDTTSTVLAHASKLYEEMTAVAANPPSEEPVASPLVPLQGMQGDETESIPSSPSRKAPGGKGKPAKGKATGKAK